MKEKLIEFIENLTPEQVDKIIARLPELEELIKEEGATNGI